MKYQIPESFRKKSIFRVLFVPLCVIMLFQSVIFYVAAVYGGIEETLNQNAADILSERLINRKNEIETMFTKSWTNLNNCENELNTLYIKYENNYGNKPLAGNTYMQVEFLSEASNLLVKTLRNNEVNGIFLILNDELYQKSFPESGSEEMLGIGLRDMDQLSNYTDREDLLLERSPSALIEKIGCTLDSWWEARYSFDSEEAGAFYYNPLNAAWENSDVDSQNLAYFEGAHRISDSDLEVVSYSIPLMDKNGYPYAVLGVELSTKYLGTIMPNEELGAANKGCYILGLENMENGEFTPIIASGSMYNRCFGANTVISGTKDTHTGGFEVVGRDQTLLYGDKEAIHIYNNNNPFENMQLTLIAFVEEAEMFSYINHIKSTLALVSGFSLALGLCGLLLVSSHFSEPITALAKKVQSLPPQDGFSLGRIGIYEIDQLVDSIEELNRDASRNIARTEFFSRMSHDMRTPMNAIISFSSNELLENADEAQKDEYLEKIHSAGDFLLGLINEVLDMTKIESNKIDLRYSPLRTGELWETVLPIIEKLAQKKKIDFQKDISMEDAAVMVDEQHLNQIVMNLLSNAVKFTQLKGTVCFKVRAVTDEKNEEQLSCQVVVSDTGIGMSEDFMKRLYRPFEQEKEGHEGTGLGLSIVKKLIDLMDGTIECSSEQGVGTTFILNFALQKCKQQDLKVEKQRVFKDEKMNFSGKKILVCEDHPINTQIIVQILERVGIEVVTAENGKIGVELFEASVEGTFDAVLLDIRMPVMDGLETARVLRRLNRTDATQIPIIAMTANAFSEDIKASREAGMNAHLSKPIEPSKLYETLQQLMK